MPKKQPSTTNELAKYSGIAFKMMAVIVAFVVAGKWCDAYFNCKPWCTISFSILSVFIALYAALHEFITDTKK